MNDIALIIPARERDLGGFHVRRVLPFAGHPMVGPFIFFDHMGPATFEPGQGVDVRPHPHIHLATVTYLFEGTIRHRDSLGSDQLIEPGAINWMTAGRGIVHSERTPAEMRQCAHRLSGIQCWVALPEALENTEPRFTHFDAAQLPEFTLEGVRLKLLLGSAFAHTSPVPVSSDLFYLDVQLAKGQTLDFPLQSREGAVYLVAGAVLINDTPLDQYAMAVGKKCGNFTIKATEDSQLMLLGGQPVGERHIYWNYVSSTKENIEKAKQDWAAGPGEVGSRFPKIPGDSEEFIPLPEEAPEPGGPKGTIM